MRVSLGIRYMDHQIVHLKKEDWKDHILPIGYSASSYYDVVIDYQSPDFKVSFTRKPFDPPVIHSPSEHDFPDKLYEDHWEKAYAWGVIKDGELLAAIESCPEEWSNRLRITELWVSEKLRGQGLGSKLISIVKEQARLERRRAIILETQSCNVNAIDFYLHEGFTLIGFDSCCYSNDDLAHREVRMEFAWFRNHPSRLSREEVILRAEDPQDYSASELLAQRAFWNKHHPGCDEHFLVRKLRTDNSYLPEISRIAVVEGKIVGSIMYSRSRVVDENGQSTELITFGPLCVDPDFQGRGIGELLLNETMRLARDAGFLGIVIYGEPDYYPRFGFKTCDHFGITTPEGKNFDAFMGIELKPGSLQGIQGKFYEAEVFQNLPAQEVDAFNQQFPPMEKQRFPCQWD